LYFDIFFLFEGGLELFAFDLIQHAVQIYETDDFLFGTIVFEFLVDHVHPVILVVGVAF